jgi:hypothetical protein
MNVWKIVSLGLTFAGGIVGIVSGVVDQKVMVAEVAEQVAKAMKK